MSSVAVWVCDAKSEWGLCEAPGYSRITIHQFGRWVLLQRHGHSKWLYAGVLADNECTVENFDQFMLDSNQWQAA